jgi:hypothetical protein
MEPRGLEQATALARLSRRERLRRQARGTRWWWLAVGTALVAAVVVEPGLVLAGGRYVVATVMIGFLLHLDRRMEALFELCQLEAGEAEGRRERATVAGAPERD